MGKVASAVLLGYFLLTSQALARDGMPFQPLTSAASASLSLSAGESTVTVPAESEAAISMLSGLHSLVSHVDDPVEAKLLAPLYAQGQVALPAGTLLEGRVTRVQPAGRFHRPAELAFQFESVTLPDGQTAPAQAMLSGMEGTPLPKARLDAEGYLKGTRGFSWKMLAGGLGVVGASVPLKAALFGAASLKYLVPASGASLVALELIVPRGNQVHVPPATQFRIRLSSPITVRAHG